MIRSDNFTALPREEAGMLRVQVTSNRLSEEKSFLSFKMTSSGLVINHISNDGEIIKSFNAPWDEIEGLLK